MHAYLATIASIALLVEQSSSGKKENRYLFEFPLKISIQISIIEMKFKDLLNDVHTYIYRFIFLIYFKHNQRAIQIARMKFEQAAINFLLHR